MKVSFCTGAKGRFLAGALGGRVLRVKGAAGRRILAPTGQISLNSRQNLRLTGGISRRSLTADDWDGPDRERLGTGGVDQLT
jgi:hypothetical protein